MLKHWSRYGGVMIVGYSMYRNLSQCYRVRSKHQKKIFQEALVDPGEKSSIIIYFPLFSRLEDLLLHQRAKKVLSDSPGLVDFAVGLVNSVFNLPDGQVMFYEEFE